MVKLDKEHTSNEEIKEALKGFDYVERTNEIVEINFKTNMEAESFTDKLEKWIKENL